MPLAVSACLLTAASAWAAFPADPPNDPGYAPAEGSANCLTTSVESDQHYLYDFMPKCSQPPPTGIGVPGATDPENASGMSVNAAWRDFTVGNGKTVIAYVEGGINWHNGDAEELRKRVFLNPKELPPPTTPDGDPDTLNVDDYNDQPAVDDANGNDNGVLDPEDLIVRYEDGVDGVASPGEADGNGYVDDISGWDFYDDQNDPATYDSTYGHANGQMKQAAAETDNGEGEAGICPKCMLLPIKGGAEALDRTDDLAQAWLYAGDVGADVIVSTTADLGYSTFMEQAVDKLWHDGVVMVESSNDFNSTDHQGGMFHAHVLPGNGVVNNAAGLNTIPGGVSNILTKTYLARASYPEWGTHNMFVGATVGGTTSESTPTVGAVLALVLAYGKEQFPRDPLTGPEAIQVVRDTALDISGNPSDPLPGWEGKPGFDLQYGYGRPNVLKAMQQIEAGEIPPVGWIDSPPWYTVYDPTKTETVPVSGHVEAERSSSYTWKLEYAAGNGGGAPGGEPPDAAFSTFATGGGTEPDDGQLGSLNISQIPQVEDFCAAQFELSQTKELETNEQYTVTIRLQVTDADGRVGEERRTIAVRCDDSLLNGFPKRIGPGGESQPVMADLQGTGALDLIFGDSDGVVHAIDPSGNELPGWPVKTNAVEVTKEHDGVDPGNEPIVPGVAVGDLDHDGRQWVVATSSTGRSYVWNANGQPRAGWPKALDEGVSAPDVPREDLDFTRLPIMGATASPVLGDLNGDGDLEVIQAGWDGYIHVWEPDGGDLPGWPVKPTKPASTGLTVIDDQKLDAPPALGELDGDPTPEVIQRSQYNETPGEGLQIVGVNGPDPPKSNLFAYNADGSSVTGWNPSKIDGLVIYYGSAQEFITEGANAPVTANVDLDPETETVAAAGIFSPNVQIDANGSSGSIYGPLPALGPFNDLVNGNLDLAGALDLLNGNLPADTPVSFTTSGAFGKVGATDTLAYAEPGSGAASVAGSLLLAGSGIPINNYMRVYEAGSGATHPSFPTQPKSQGLDFLGAPAIADVTGDGAPEVLEGGDSSALHAFTDSGAQAAGFPKFMPGWILFGPATGDLDSDGKVEVAAMTREGYLMAWRTEGTIEGNNEWWNYRHDERNTAQYGVDTRPPGIIRTLSGPPDGSSITFTAPGDDWYAGTATSYEVVSSPNPITPENFDSLAKLSGTPAPLPSGDQQSYTLATAPSRYIAIRAIDDARNLGPIRVRDLGSGVGPPGAGGGAGGGVGGATGGSQKLQVRVKPKRARAQRRACFKIIVTTPDGTPVAGARAKLGKKSRLTNAAGRARICRRFPHAGRRQLSVTKPGFESTSRKLRVKRPL